MADQIRFSLYPNRYHKAGINPETGQPWDKRPVATGRFELEDDVRLGRYKAAAWRFGDRLNVVLTPVVEVAESRGAEQTGGRQPASDPAPTAPPPSSPPPSRPRPLRDNLDI